MELCWEEIQFQSDGVFIGAVNYSSCFCFDNMIVGRMMAVLCKDVIKYCQCRIPCVGMVLSLRF